MDKIMIVVDLGHFRAFRVKSEQFGKGKIELIESYDSLDAHGKLLDKITDQAGRFKFGGGRDGVQKAKGYGEPHNTKEETERKLIKSLAKDINSLLSREKDYDGWFFAAAEEIDSRILDGLSAGVKARMEKHLIANLTNFGKADILKHFEAA